MTENKLDRWLGLLGQIAVLIGLIVVAYEIRQSAAIANGEMTAQFMTNWQDFDRSLHDPGFATTLAKSMESPDELTLAEMVQLDGHYWVVMDQFQLARMMVEKGLFVTPYEVSVRDNVHALFATPYAQAWWETNKRFFDPVTVGLIDEELAKVPSDAALRRFEAIATKLGGE